MAQCTRPDAHGCSLPQVLDVNTELQVRISPPLPRRHHHGTPPLHVHVDRWSHPPFPSPPELQSPPCTVRFAAPEVAAARQARPPHAVRMTPAVDVWALGLILYELFTGHHLLKDDEVEEKTLATRPELAVQRLADEPTSASSPATARLTDPQKRLLRDMLCVRPEERVGLRELLAKSFFNMAEDTEEAQHVEVLALFS